MAAAYEISFKHEILNEVIADIMGFISRKFDYENLPEDISELKDEVHEIYDKIPLEDDIITLDGYDRRLLEIRNYVIKRGSSEVVYNGRFSQIR